MSVNAHYEVVLADLRQMKAGLEAKLADADAGIAALERLMAGNGTKASTTKVSEPATPIATNHAEGHISVPQQVGQFLASQPGKSFTIGETAKAIGVKNLNTLRGALGRMLKAGTVARHGRGRYRAP